MTKNTRTKILLRACPRCQGDLFPDQDENDFACLQCGRRVSAEQAELARAERSRELVAA